MQEGATRAFEVILGANPNSVDALRGLAALAVERENFDQALDYQARLIDKGERSPELFYNTGLLLQKIRPIGRCRAPLQGSAARTSIVPRGSAQSGPRAQEPRASRTKPATAGSRRWNKSRNWRQGYFEQPN